MSISFCLPYPVAVSVFMICRGLCACTEMLWMYVGHFIIWGTFSVRQVTYAIKMKYFTIKTNSFFLSRMNSI